MIFLGEGVDGCVLNDKGQAVKYSIEPNSLKREYANIKLLPKKDFYINPDEVSLSLVKADEEQHVMSLCHSLNRRKNRTKDYVIIKMNMPLIDGYSVDKILGSKLSADEYFELIKAFLFFIPKVIELNNVYKIYHNDLHFGNMMYDINKKKIMMVDFSNITLNEPNNEDSAEGEDDQPLLYILLERIINFSIENSDVKKFLYEHSVIDENDKLKMTGIDLYEKLYEILI